MSNGISSIKINGIKAPQQQEDVHCFNAKSSEELYHCTNSITISLLHGREEISQEQCD